MGQLPFVLELLLGLQIIIVTHLDGMCDTCSPKSSVALFQQATALDPRTRSLPSASYPGRSVDVRSAWLAVGNSRELGLKRGRISGGYRVVRYRGIYVLTDERTRSLSVFLFITTSECEFLGYTAPKTWDPFRDR